MACCVDIIFFVLTGVIHLVDYLVYTKQSFFVLNYNFHFP